MLQSNKQNRKLYVIKVVPLTVLARYPAAKYPAIYFARYPFKNFWDTIYPVRPDIWPNVLIYLKIPDIFWNFERKYMIYLAGYPA